MFDGLSAGGKVVITVFMPQLDERRADLYGNPRILDGDGDGRPMVDIGAIEHRPVGFTTSPPTPSQTRTHTNDWFLDHGWQTGN